MKFIFTNVRFPKSIDDLSTEEKEQIVIAGNLYHGEEYSAETLAAKEEDDENYEEEVSFFNLEIWDVVDESSELKYKLYLYMVRWGTLFKDNSTEVAREIIQLVFECFDDELADLLFKAQKEAKKEYKNKELLGVSFD